MDKAPVMIDVRAIGRKGGLVKSEKKANAARINGRRGGRPSHKSNLTQAA